MLLENPDDPTPSFIEDIIGASISRKFKIPTIKDYDGMSNLANHVNLL